MNTLVNIQRKKEHGDKYVPLTPCDVGRAVTATDQEERARQNVVYEHGLFQGYLGRKRVFTLRKGNTMLPGDCSGVVYISVDSGKWQEQLKNNIQAIDQ